jgi:hypothetical protein
LTRQVFIIRPCLEQYSLVYVSITCRNKLLMLLSSFANIDKAYNEKNCAVCDPHRFAKASITRPNVYVITGGRSCHYMISLRHFSRAQVAIMMSRVSNPSRYNPFSSFNPGQIPLKGRQSRRTEAQGVRPLAGSHLAVGCCKEENVPRPRN